MENSESERQSNHRCCVKAPSKTCFLFIMSAAFSRTRTLLALKEAHPMAMSKWWGKKRHAEAEVSRFQRCKSVCSDGNNLIDCSFFRFKPIGYHAHFSVFVKHRFSVDSNFPQKGRRSFRYLALAYRNRCWHLLRVGVG